MIDKFKYKIIIKPKYYIFFIYLLLTILFFKDWIGKLSSSILGNPDSDGTLNIWIAYWPYLKLKSIILQEEIANYLESNIFTGFYYGYTFSDMMPGLVPFISFLDFISGNPVLVINILHLFMIVLLPFSTYLFCREFGFGVYSSFFAGLVCSYTEFHLRNLLHFQLQFAFLIPLGLMFLMRFFSTKDLKNIIFFSIIFIFTSSVSSHIYIYIVFSSVLLFIVYFSYILLTNGRFELSKNLSNLFNKNVLKIIFFTIIISIFIVSPYISNYYIFHFKRFRVETLLFALNPLDIKGLGFDYVTLFIFILSILFLCLPDKILGDDTGNLITFFFLSFLLYTFSLGAIPYYPYSFLYNFFPGFSSIRDVSRILYLFWIMYALLTALFFQKCYELEFRNNLFNFVKKFFLFLIIVLEIILIYFRIPVGNHFEISDRLVKIHEDYKNGLIDEPLLILADEDVDMAMIDVKSQFLSISHKKKLIGGYSGYHPTSIYMLRYAINSYLNSSGEWNIDQIRQIVSNSPVKSIIHLNDSEIYRDKINAIMEELRDSNQLKPCSTKITGIWRNMPQISPRYGMVFGFTPRGDFCVNEYNRYNDKEIKVLWKVEGSEVYRDSMYFSTPFYYHPNAPEILYMVDGFRKKNNYDLELYLDNQLIYTGKVIVR